MTLPPPRTKLLFYIPGLLDGGAERLWSCLASAFHARGYAVVFAQDFEAADNRHNLDPAIPVHTLGRNHASSVRALARVMAAERPDVTLSAVAGSNLKLMLARQLSRSNAAPVLTYHGFEEWRTGLASLATFASLPVLSRSAARVVAVSDGLRDTLVTRWGSRAANTVAIHNPVYFPPAAPVPTLDEIAGRPPVVLAAGRLSADKDFATLLRAFAFMKRTDAKLVILGKGPERANLEAEIMRLGLRSRVELAGYVAQPWRRYETARVFACPSRTESFGNAIVEAMAHGLSVVSTGCDGPNEILDRGVYGRLTPIGDEAALAHAIDEALTDPSHPATQRQRADAFSFATRVPIYERLITDVLAERTKRRKGTLSHRAPATPSVEPDQIRYTP